MARKILLADDSVTAQNMGRKILTDAGYEVITVNNGSAALKRVAEHKPDLVVLDVYMPGYSGLEVCQRLKDAPETARIPILLTVGKLEPFKAEDARRVNADAFIIKPFEASELMGALARLEDRMVPQAGGSRFSTSVSGIERFISEAPNRRSQAGEESDTGWKSRLRFPSAKPKSEETEPEPDYVTPVSFRDFRRAPIKPPTPAAPSASFPESPTVQEPGLVPDIPRDITPDELDALSALVAKLDGPIPQAEEIAPLSDKIGPSAIPAPEVKAEAPAADVATAEIAPSPRAEDSVPAPVEAEVVPPPVEAAAEVPDEPKAAWSEPEVVPAPVDRDDEPLFAQAPMVIPEVAAEESRDPEDQHPESEDQVEPVAEAKEFAKPPQAENQPKIEDLAKAEEQPKSEDLPKTEDLAKMEDQPKPEEIAREAVVAAVVEEAAAFGEQGPTEEELAEALRLLTPQREAVLEPTAMTAAPEEAVPVSAGTAALEGTAQSAGNRWVAEAVSLSPAEAAVSLEAEMFRTLAPPSIATPAPVVAEEMAPIPASEEVPLAAVAEATAPAVTTEPLEMAASAEAEESRANPEDSRKQVAEAPEEPSTATFALQSAEAEAASAVESSMPMTEETPADLEVGPPAPQESQESSSEAAAEGEESMGKEGKTGKSGKSGWHQIRATPASAGATGDVVEAKQAQPEAEAAPKAMAAAAAADGASAISADASAIASIVDSVLADLRPKIVEEIAKKLGKK
ncbi:MAG: response regulator [Terriglobales bacterium]